MSDLMRAYKGITDAQDHYIKAEAYYNGTQPEFFASRRLRRALERTGNPWRLNYCRTVVKSVLDMLELTGVSTPNDPDQEWLNLLWENNGLDAETDEIHEWFLAHGDAYAIVWPSETLESGVSIMFNSARTTRVFYEHENPRVPTLGSQVWKREDEKVRLNLYYPDRIEKYLSKNKAPKTEAAFEPFVDVIDSEGDAVWPIDNPYDQIPIFHFRTKSPYGRPEHLDAYPAQDMVNKLVINQMNTVDFHGFPQRYVVTEPDVDDDFEDIDGEFDEPSVTSEEKAPSLRQTPDSVWWLKRVKEVGQFESADADAFLKPLERYINAMASLTQTPLHDFEASNTPQSGESRRIARAPLIKKVDSRRQRLEPVWKDLFRFAAMVAERGDVDISLDWAPSQSADDSEAWELVRSKQQAGVPRDRTLVEAGYEEEEVSRWTSVDIESLGIVVQRLGVGVQMGVLTQEQANRIIEPMLGSDDGRS